LPLRALVVANLISESGNAITYLAIPWYAYELTHNAFVVGLVAATGVAAFVLGAFFGGSLADRFDRRMVAVVADGASGVAVLAVPLLHAMGALPLPVLVILVFLGAILDAPGYAARTALIPELSRRGGYTLERANGLVSGAASAAEVAGPVLAGLLLTATSTPVALIVDGGSFFVSMVLVFLYLPRRMGRVSDLSEEDLTKVSVRDGIRFLSRPGPPRLITVANLATNFIGAPLFTVIMVAYLANRTAGGLSLGVLVAVGGIGLTLGALVFARIGPSVSRRLLFVGGFAAFGAQYWFLAFEPAVLFILIIFLVRGVLTGFYNPVSNTVMQERVPDPILGTVLGTHQAMGMVGQPIGLLVGGLVVEHYGVRTAIISAGAAYAAVTLLLALAPSTRQMERPAGARDVEVAADEAPADVAAEPDDVGEAPAESASPNAGGSVHG
jgi:MFS family permease